MFAGLLIGAMLPYWFSSMTMKSVGKAALAMVEEVRQQFNTIAGLMEGTARPDYRRCVEISTKVRCLAALLAAGHAINMQDQSSGEVFHKLDHKSDLCIAIRFLIPKPFVRRRPWRR